MSSPRNTNNTQNNSQAREYRKSGNPLGVLFGLLILGGACFGLYYLWKMKNGNGNISSPFNQASSLNLNSAPNTTNTSPTQSNNSPANINSNPNSNSNQYQYSNNSPNQQPNRPPSINGANNNFKPKTQNNQTQKLIYQSKDGRKRVLSGYGGGNNTANKSNQIASRFSGYISPNKVLPARGLIPGSLQSLISDNKSLADGLPRPNQLIYFATNFYPKEKALSFASNKLKALGFYRTRLSSDEYDQGRQAIVEGLDSNNNQAFFFFKPNNNETLWKLEIYKAGHLASN